MHNLLRGFSGDFHRRSKSSGESRSRFPFERFLRPRYRRRELIKYHQSSRLSGPTDALRNVCLRRIARVRLGVIYRGGLSECQKYRIIIPRVRALARVRAEFTTGGYREARADFRS